MTRELLVLLAFTASMGCSPTIDEDDDYYDAPCRSSGQIPFAPGQTVRGHDPQALLQPFFGTWSGPFEWRSGGGRTELTLSVPQDPDAPIYFTHCSGPPGATTDATGMLTTSDGALRDAVSLGVTAIVPGIATRDRYSNVWLDALSDWQWQGTIAEKIPGLERYDSGYVVLQLEREPITLELRTGVLEFTGERTDSALPDTFELGTWQVQ